MGTSLPQFPHPSLLLHQLCQLTSCLGALAPPCGCASPLVSLACSTRATSLQLKPPSLTCPWHTCCGDVIQVPQGLLITMRWTKAHKTVASSPVLPIPMVPGHPADPMDAFHHLIASSTSSSPDHPLLSFLDGPKLVSMPILKLAAALANIVQVLGLDPALYTPNSLR